MDGWEKMWNSFEKKYYAEPVLWIVELIAILVGILTVSKQRIGIYFLLYIACDFLFFIFDSYLLHFSDIRLKYANRLIHQSNIIISLTEMAVYSYFFKSILISQIQKRFIKIIFIAFCILSILFILSESFVQLNFTYAFLAYSTSNVAFIFLTIYSFLYYKQMLNSESTLNLLSRPSFWIVTGILFYSFISIPYYILGTYLNKTQYQYMYLLDALLFFFPFTLNFLFLIKAFLCKRPLTK
jgi:hypothetical protein